jgi:Lysyl oxidase
VLAGLAVVGVAVVLLATGAETPPPAARAVLPDLDQAVPQEVAVVPARSKGRRRYRLAFASAVDNVGAGPLIVEGRRRSVRDKTMIADQVLELEDGSSRTRRRTGVIRYVRSRDHAHWHLLRFDRYELRRVSDYRLVRPDRKTGFCLGDRYRLGDASVESPPRPAFHDECGKRDPMLLRVREGISPGYGDNYRAYLERQYIDVTDVREGRYHLVHTVNAGRELREANYANNAASVLIEIRGSGSSGGPRARVLKRCPGAARCAARSRSARAPG